MDLFVVVLQCLWPNCCTKPGYSALPNSSNEKLIYDEPGYDPPAELRYPVLPLTKHTPILPPTPPASPIPDSRPFSRENDTYSLWWSALEGVPKVAEYLIRQGVDVNATYNGTTPLVQSAMSGTESVTEVLLGVPDINVNLRNHAGQNALWCAANLGFSGIVKLLLDKGGIEIDCMDESGFTPLATAVVEGHPEVVKLLLANGADINTRDKLYQLSPIFWAISFEREDIANVLIDEESIDLASRDRYGRTPLHCAVEHRLHLVLRWLLRKGADANIPDDEGQTPLDKARMADDIAMEDLLKDWNNPQFS